MKRYACTPKHPQKANMLPRNMPSRIRWKIRRQLPHLAGTISYLFGKAHSYSTLLHWCNWYLFIPVLLPIPTEFGLSEPQPKAQETVILIGLFEQVFGSSQLIDGHPEFQHSSRPQLPVFGNIYISPLCFKRCFVASLQPSRKNNDGQ